MLNNKKVFKINYLVNNIIKVIYVFNGQINEQESEIFNETELKNIKESQTQIVFSKETIHLDDSILTIKMKIFNELNKKDKNISLDEIYLFSQKQEKINIVSLFKTLTLNKKVELSK